MGVGVTVTPTPIAGVMVVGTQVSADHRGAFARLFCHEALGHVVGSRQIVQINQSRTSRVGAVRGMHFQRAPMAEMKLVRFRSLGCYPLSAAVESTAATLDDIIDEMRTSRESERAGRLIDTDEAASMEKKKREWYF